MTPPAHPQNLDLAPVGNCSVSALIDRQGRFVWSCAPRVDSDPVFSALLGNRDYTDPEARGFWSIEVQELTEVRQEYLRNTAVLRTELTDAQGAALEILDFAPRYRHSGRVSRCLNAQNDHPAALLRDGRPRSVYPACRPAA